MAVNHIRYDLLVQDALRGALRTVLVDTAKNGLPGEHHFYITFKTEADGVGLSERMRAQYPEEMTIVLQHQFWDLMVGEEAFEVGLAFGGITERLVIPFAAVSRFFDPSVPFEVRFEEIAADAVEAEAGGKDAGEERTAKGRSGEPPRPAAEQKNLAAVSPPANAEPPDPDKPAGGEVVRLDRFRKK